MVKKLSNQTERKDGAIRVKDLHHKLLSQGNQALTEIELITLVLNYRGNCEIPVEKAAKIFNYCENQLHEFSSWTYEELKNLEYLDDNACALLLAVWELSNRRWRRRDLFPLIKSSSDAYNLFASRIGVLNHEEFHVALLNRTNGVIHVARHSSGGVSGTVVDIRMIIQMAVMRKASAILIAHNHPSGIVKPSKEDTELTEKMKLAAQYFDIQLLDHIIISGTDYFSFADNGKL